MSYRNNNSGTGYNRFSSNNANNKVTNNNNKIIYADQDLFVGQTASGNFYLFHTTSDPAEKFKQRKIGDICQRPSKEFIDEQQRYGQNGEKIRWKLNKEKVESWLLQEYDYKLVEYDSPWAPKVLGVVSTPAPVPPAKRASPDFPDDFEDNPEGPQKKIAPAVSLDTAEIKEQLNSIFILVQEIAIHMRNSDGNNTEEDTKSSPVQTHV